MLSVGTDGCRHLSSLRWDSGPYFEADKDFCLKTWGSNDLVIIDFLFLKPEYLGNNEISTKDEMKMQKKIPTTLAMLFFRSLKRGFPSFTVPDVVCKIVFFLPGHGDWSLVCVLDIEKIKEYPGQKHAEMGYMIYIYVLLLFASKLEEDQGSRGSCCIFFQDTGMDVGK